MLSYRKKLGFEKSCWQKLKETSSLGGPVGPAMPPPSAPFRTNAEGDAFYAKYPCSKYALFIMVALAGVVLFFIGAVWRPSALSYKNKHRLTANTGVAVIGGCTFAMFTTCIVWHACKCDAAWGGGREEGVDGRRFADGEPTETTKLMEENSDA